MKLQCLTIHNIASIEDATIDFAAQPLAGSEVFLITGKTGAGKSTILDAICLALYATTPRLQGWEDKARIDDMTFNDARQVLRRNTGEGYVALTFIGSNDVSYKAEWSVARSRGKADGRLQLKKWSLTNLQTSTTLSKDTEIRAEICAAVGLDFNQFCRTTILAQGEFTRFLNSKENDKAEILEKITGVDVYSRIGAKVYEMTAESQRQWEEATRRVKAVAVLSEEALSQLRDELAAQRRAYAEAQTQSAVARGKAQWLADDARLAAEIAKAEGEKQRIAAVVQSEAFKADTALVTQWNATIEARAQLSARQRAEADAGRQRVEIQRQRERYALLLKGLRWETEQKAAAEKESAELAAALSAEASRTEAYRQAQTITGHVNTIRESRRGIAEQQRQRAEQQRHLDGPLTVAHDKAEKALKTADKALREQTAETRKHETLLAEAGLPALRKEKDAGQQRLTVIATALDRLQTMAAERTRRQGREQALAQMLADIEQRRKAVGALAPDIAAAEARRTACQEALERQRATVDKWAKSIRQTLHQGDRCPVCGQVVAAELPQESMLAELFAEAAKALDEARKQCDALASERNAKTADINSLSVQHRREQAAYLRDTALDTATRRAREACRACGIETVGDDTAQALDNLAVATRRDVDALVARIAAAEAIEAEVKRCRAAGEARRADVDRARDAMNKADADVAGCRSRIAANDNAIRAMERYIAHAQQEMERLVVVEHWRNDWHTAADAFARELSEAKAAYDTMLSNQQKAATAAAEHAAVVADVAQAAAAIAAIQKEWQTVVADEGQQLPRLSAAATRLMGDVESAAARLAASLDEARKADEGCRKALADNPAISEQRLAELCRYTYGDIKEREKKTAADLTALREKTALVEHLCKQRSESETRKPAMDDGDTAESLAALSQQLEQRMRDASQRCGAVEQRLTADAESRASVAALLTEAEERKATYERWSRLNQLLGDSTGAKFRRIAQSYVLGSLISAANAYMRTLTDRYTLRVRPGTFVITLEDAYQGYVQRAASTISGGESFLVSLSLALALSDIGQRLAVDTLFIDEGFGTLSGEPLQNAVATLRTLHTTAGRHVGIISHVEELQERIPVQIVVSQEGNNSSSSVSIVPAM